MKAVTIDPEIMSGTPCFTGTRVPVQNLFDYIEGGDTVDEFLRQFPRVAREQALDVLAKGHGKYLADLNVGRRS